MDGSQWKTLLAYYQASQIRPFELEDTSFAEMRDAGDLGLIADERLRVGLAKYYRLGGNGIQAQILRHDPVYRVQVRGLVPTDVQAYIWTHCYQQLEGTDQRLIDCASPIPESRRRRDPRDPARIGLAAAEPALLEHLAARQHVRGRRRRQERAGAGCGDVEGRLVSTKASDPAR